MPDLSVNNLTFRYSTGFALREISLKIPEATFLALIGPNGSGKTTLLYLLSGLLRPVAGEVRVDAEPLKRFTPRQLARRIAVISSEQYFEFPFRVTEIVSMGRYPHLGKMNRLTQKDRLIVDEALSMTETAHLSDRPISKLSSGERQRVLIARAIAQQPSILMLDEPNAHLDIHHQLAVFRLLQQLNERHSMTVIVVLHDLTAAAAFCQSVALLHEGSLVKQGKPEEVITTELLRRIYGADVYVYPSPLGGFPQVTYGGREKDRQRTADN